MAFINLNDITLKTTWKAKELDILNFNSLLADLELFVNTLNNNINFNQDQIMGIPLDADAPGAEYQGDYWFKIVE